MDSTKAPAKDSSQNNHDQEKAAWKERFQSLLLRLSDFGIAVDVVRLCIVEMPDQLSDEAVNLVKDFALLMKSFANLWPEEHVVLTLNAKHALIHTDSTYVLTEKSRHNSKQMDFSLETRQSFLNFYESQKVECDKGKVKTMAQIWLNSPDQRRYDKGLIFDPTTTAHRNGHYNLWRGFAVEPKQGSCELFKQHLKKIICAGNKEHYEYVWRWLASLIQHPERRSTALLLMGAQGTGKGVFVQGIGHLFGLHFTHIDNLTQVLGNFNYHLKSSVLVFCDEALWGGNRKDIGRVKAMITEEKMLIEPKGKDAIVLPNFRHFIFASNESWPLHLDQDDRRVMVLKVSDERRGDYEYFNKIDHELKNGGYEALLHELLSSPLQEKKSLELPTNNNSFSVKMLSANTPEKYLYECLLAGSFDIGNAEIQEGWKETVPSSRLYSDYCSWCERQGLRREDQRIMAARLYKILPSSKRIRVGSPVQTYCMSFKTLAQCRIEFQKAFGADESIWSENDRPEMAGPME